MRHTNSVSQVTINLLIFWEETSMDANDWTDVGTSQHSRVVEIKLEYLASIYDYFQNYIHE